LAPSALSASTSAVTRPGSRLAAAGHAEGPDAAAGAVGKAVRGLEGSRPSLILIFPDGGLDAAEQLHQAEAHAVGAPVAGMTASGALGGDGPLDRGCSAMAFGGELAAGVGVAPRASRDLRKAGGEAARAALREVGDADRANLLLALFIDTSSGD
jgi:hypothetical protein